MWSSKEPKGWPKYVMVRSGNAQPIPLRHAPDAARAWEYAEREAGSGLKLYRVTYRPIGRPKRGASRRG